MSTIRTTQAVNPRNRAMLANSPSRANHLFSVPRKAKAQKVPTTTLPNPTRPADTFSTRPKVMRRTNPK